MAQIKLETQLDRANGNVSTFTFRIQVPRWLKDAVLNDGAFVVFEDGYYDMWGEPAQFYVSNEKRKNDDEIEGE